MEDENTGAKMRTRIYVGGLGGSITMDDLKKTFSSPQLGTVEAVEINRTKGRSFAYIDFHPSSDKGLAKLFSTYNGCMWKGGRLKLEKAKEDYVVRLRREWSEDCELANTSCSQSVTAQSVPSAEKPKKTINSAGMQLRIFFPKYRKIKLIPTKGTGKHKYSFQRVEVPPLPIHFCDCEEHSGPSDATMGSGYCEYEKDSGVINEEELNLMNSVMNKIFGREKSTKPANKETDSVQVPNPVNSIDDLEDDNLADQDEDNILINIVNGKNYKIAGLDKQGDTPTKAVKKTGFNFLQASKDKSAQRTHESQRRQDVLSNKRKVPLNEGCDGKFVSPKRQTTGIDHIKAITVDTEPTEPESRSPKSIRGASSSKSLWRDLISERAKFTFQIADITPSINSKQESDSERTNIDEKQLADKENQKTVSQDDKQESESDMDNFCEKELVDKEIQKTATQPQKLIKPAEPALDKPNGPDKSARGGSWLQKSSWTQLVSDPSASSFSISQILPGMASEKPELPLFKFNMADGNVLKEKASGPQGGTMTKLSASHNPDIDALAEKASDPETKPQETRRQDSACLRKIPTTPPKQTSMGQTSTAETCPFMRNAASMKEWTKIKSALSSSLKKKADMK